MTLSDRLREARKNAGLSQKDFAEKLGLNVRTYASYERGERDISTALLLNICKTLNISSDRLLGNTINEDSRSVSIHDAIPFDPDRMRAFPVLGKVSAGMGSFTDPDNMIGTMTTDIDGLIEDYDYVWLRVEGDSMEPELLDGDYVLVRVQETAETGDLSVVLVDNESGVVKRIDYEEQNHITLISNNPRYAPRVFVREEMNRVRVFGKVVKMSRCF